MNAKIRYGLSAAVLALIGAGASAPEILDQFLDEKEGNHTTAYRDGAGIWTICRGATRGDGKPVIPDMKRDKNIASVFATGLNEWKQVKAAHVSKIRTLVNEANMLIDFVLADTGKGKITKAD
ncbi:hypothetical protein KQ663_04710 [Escherichia coli O157:H7]|uniref:glycoside hydrolase family protein n=1 Tax=Escherichia coli TaxID=562 RepID=UPI001C1DD7D2|nr:hypothetical protein [Escherichia coli]MBU6010458.1 hypothetical protein [Escherichia coli O157:H7]